MTDLSNPKRRRVLDPATTEAVGRHRRRESALLAAAMLAVAVTVAVTLHPVLSCTALSFDDNEYIIENRLVRNPSWESVGAFFSEVTEPSTVPGYYQPLAMTSLMVDVAAGGRPDNLRPFHRTGLALHALNAALVVLLTHQLFGGVWAAIAVGLLFGLHPAATEVLPWVAQRKALLSTFFSLLCLASYVRFARVGGRVWFVTALLMYVPALLSKPTAVPLAVVLVVLDWWPLERLNKRALVEKVPFLFIAVVFAVITYVSQSRTAGTVASTQQAWWHAPLILGYTVSFYPRQLLWPADWPGYYSFPSPFSFSNGVVLAYVSASTTLLVILTVTLRWTRAWFAGWLGFFLLILPTLGIIGFTEVLAANRFLYTPMIALTWPIAAALRRAGRGASPAQRLKSPRVALSIAVVIVLVVGEASASRSALVRWEDTVRLNRHLAGVAPNAPKVRFNLAKAMSDAGDADDAIREYRTVIAIEPDFAQAYNNLAAELTDAGRPAEAVPLFERSLQLAPDNARAHNSFGGALLKLGRADDALRHFREAIAIKPDLIEAHFNLGGALLDRARWAEGVTAFENVVRLDPRDAEAHARLGYALERLNDTDRAVHHYLKTLELDPSHGVAAARLKALRSAHESRP